MSKHDPRITYETRPSGWVLWTIRPRPDGPIITTNGAERNMAKARKAAEHALRMIDNREKER